MSDVDNDTAFFDRQWVYSADKYDGTHYISEITVTDHYCNAVMTISDGSRAIYLDFDFDEEQDYDRSIKALLVLINGLTELKDKVVEEREKWVAGTEQREAEKKALRESILKSRAE